METKITTQNQRTKENPQTMTKRVAKKIQYLYEYTR